MCQDALHSGPFLPDLASSVERKSSFPGRSHLALAMHHPPLMDWMMITAWGLTAGLTACGVAAFEWLEARTEQRRRSDRLHKPGFR